MDETANQKPKSDRLRPTQFLQKRNDGAGKGFVVKRHPINHSPVKPEHLPCPPANLLKYGHDTASFLETGRRDADTLVTALDASGFKLQQSENVLEFGCANGRVMRWLTEWAERGEFWGVDVDSDRIFWCHEHLSPPFRFAVSTTAPGLFFEDHFFSLVYCYSVFTHIDDMFLSWICELRRITRPGGFLFVTIIDERAEQIQNTRNGKLKARREAATAHKQFREQQGDFVTIGRGLQSLVTMRRDYAIEIFSPGFELVRIVENTMGELQTAIVLKRK